MKTYKYIILCILLLLIGFLLGRFTVITKEFIKTEIKYVPQEPVNKDSIHPNPPTEVQEHEPIYLTKVDTLWRDSVRYVIEKVDTSAILADWSIKRKYNETLFNNDSVGTLNFTADIQYNRLQHYGYQFTPIRKEVSTTTIINKKPFIEPFIMGGVNSYWKPSIEAGVFTRSGVGASYGIEWSDQNKTIHSLKIGYKF